MSEEFDNKVIEILEIVDDDPDTNIPKCADKIHALADYARRTPIYKEGTKVGNDLFSDYSLVEIYNHMIIKIVESPTKYHRDGAVILILPYISDRLKEMGK